MRKRTYIAFAVLVLITLMAGCQRPAANGVATNGSVEPTQLVTDDLGREILVTKNIRRIVSTAPSITENVFAVGAGDRLVGVTTFCNFPEEAKSIAKIGDTMTPNMETIVALKPDIVLVSTASQIEAFSKTLEENGIAVYVTNPGSLDDVFRNMTQLADLFGTKQAIADSLPELKKRVGAVSDRVVGQESMRVFVQISKEPLFTIGKESFLNAVLAKAGAQSVTSDVATAYPKLSKETALALRPEAIILSASDDNREPNEVFKNSPAIKNDRVYSIDADLLSRPGPRLVDALEQIAKLLHPEKFGKTEN